MPRGAGLHAARCALHANSAREAVTKARTLPLLAGENISARFVVPTVAGSVDLVVYLTVASRGSRKVAQIVAVWDGSSRTSSKPSGLRTARGRAAAGDRDAAAERQRRTGRHRVRRLRLAVPSRGGQIVGMRLLDDSVSTGVRPDSVQASGGMLSSRLPTPSVGVAL
jgi:hypothetical protein